MRSLLIYALFSIPAAAQTPQVRFVNLSHPLSNQVQVGDRFEIEVTGAPGQPVSVRTTRAGQTDWGPAIASTDSFGRWSASGQFEKGDFGGWSEVWTVGGKLAAPVVQFSVNAPCLPDGSGIMMVSGTLVQQVCDTAEGSQTFVTPSGDSWRTPDGRLVAPVRPGEQTQEQYQMARLTDAMSGDLESARISLSSSKGGLGDGTAALIDRMIGGNGLSEKETRNVLAVLRTAFEKPETIAPDAREPFKTLAFLRRLMEVSEPPTLKQQIADTAAYVEAR